MTSSFSLEGKNSLIAGGTRGIGRAISLEFARAGSNVLANFVRGQQAAESLVAEAENEHLKISVCRGDLTQPGGLDALGAAVATMEGDLHCLVYCAATGVHKKVEDLTLRHYDWTFALNVRAYFDLVKRLLPRLAHGASIVAVSSQGAVRSIPAYAVVGASKGAMESLSRHLAVELAPRGIRVNILSPGAVETDAWQAMPDGKERLAAMAQRTPLGRLATPEDAAMAARFLCSDAARSISGHTLVVDGGASVPL